MRNKLNSLDFVMLVEAAVNKLIKAKRDFSAYDVTLTLRIENPETEITHDEVRDVVHNKMSGGAYGSHKSPHRNDFQEETRRAGDGRPYIFYLYDPNWFLETQLADRAAREIVQAFVDNDRQFTIQDALKLAPESVPARRSELFMRRVKEVAIDFGWFEKEGVFAKGEPTVEEEDETEDDDWGFDDDDEDFDDYDDEDEDDNEIDDDDMSPEEIELNRLMEEAVEKMRKVLLGHFASKK